MENINDELSKTYFLTAGECDAQGLMPIWLIAERAIETAIEHANSLSIGYSDLLKFGIGWVLTRLSIEMKRYPKINDTYTVTTWIEGYNRRFSDRCYVITDADGEEIGHIRSMWMAINFATREGADLGEIEKECFPVSARACPVSRPGKVPPMGADDIQRQYTFRFCDLDFNRHVNTIQYIKLILNGWTLDHYDANAIDRFDVTFHHECLFGQTVDIAVRTADNISHCSIILPDSSHPAVSSSIRCRPRL